jgi:hypothetical protein
VFITRRTPLYLFNTDEGAGGSQAPEQDSLDTTTEQSQEDIVNWEKRAHDNQAWGHQMAQEAAELRRQNELYTALLSEDEELRLFAAQELGLDHLIDYEDDTDADQDPVAAVAARLDAMEAQAQRQAEEELREQRIQELEDNSVADMNALGVPDVDAVRDFIVRYALSLDPTPKDTLDIQAAYEAFQALPLAQQAEAAAETEDIPHYVTDVGQEGTHTPDLDDRQQRRAWMANQLKHSQ